jgi:hypothetical protein
LRDIHEHGSDPIQRDDKTGSDDKEQRRHRHEGDVVHGVPQEVDLESLWLDQRIEQVAEQREQQHATDHDHNGAPVAWA